MEQPSSLDKTINPLLDSDTDVKKFKGEFFEENSSTKNNDRYVEDCSYLMCACFGVFDLCLCIGECIFAMGMCLDGLSGCANRA